MQTLFKKEPKPNTYQKFPNGQTVLHIAVENGAIECIFCYIKTRILFGVLFLEKFEVLHRLEGNAVNNTTVDPTELL